MAKRKKKAEDSIEELKAQARDLDRQIFLMRNELSVQRKLEKPHQLKEMRKNRARVLTILTQKQKGIA